MIYQQPDWRARQDALRKVWKDLDDRTMAVCCAQAADLEAAEHPDPWSLIFDEYWS